MHSTVLQQHTRTSGDNQVAGDPDAPDKDHQVTIEKPRLLRLTQVELGTRIPPCDKEKNCHTQARATLIYYICINENWINTDLP